jgi:RHS repeat-associated protein
VQFYRDATFQLSYGRTVDDYGRTLTTFDRPSAQLTSATVQPTGSGAFASTQLAYGGHLPTPLVTAINATTGSSGYGFNNENDLMSSHGDQPGSIYTNVAYTDYTPDVAGRVKLIKTTVEGSGNGGHPNLVLTQGFTYYPNGRIQSSPQGTFAYDDRGLLATRQVAGGGTYRYQYDELGRNTLLTYPDGHTRKQGYDNEGRLNSRCYAYQNWTTRCYGALYDAVGNPTTLTDPEGTDTITYDPIDRVSTVHRVKSDGTIGDEAYHYNALGALSTNAGVPINDQRPMLSGTGTAPSAIPSAVNSQSVIVNGGGQVTALGATTLGYDLKGNVTSVAGNAMHRDEYARIAGDDSAGAVYTYDGANRSGLWTYGATGWVQHGFWLYDGIDHPLEHVDESGNRQYYELDLAGNVRRLTTSARSIDPPVQPPQGDKARWGNDSIESPSPRPIGLTYSDLGGYRYTAFGQTYPSDSTTPWPTGAASLPVRWKGRWLLYSTNLGTASAVELYDMRARVWWPQGGVFVSVDDFAYADGTGTVWAWPGQNPYRWSDPSGHFAWVLAGAAGGAVIGAGLSLATQLYDGQCINWGSVGQAAVKGALVGGLLGFGGGLLLGEGGVVALKAAGVRALGGAISGGVSAAIQGKSLGAIATQAAINADVAAINPAAGLGGAWSSMANSAISNAANQDVYNGTVDPAGVAGSAAARGVFGLATGSLPGVVGSVAGGIGSGFASGLVGGAIKSAGW